MTVLDIFGSSTLGGRVCWTLGACNYVCRLLVLTHYARFACTGRGRDRAGETWLADAIRRLFARFAVAATVLARHYSSGMRGAGGTIAGPISHFELSIAARCAAVLLSFDGSAVCVHIDTLHSVRCALCPTHATHLGCGVLAFEVKKGQKLATLTSTGAPTVG